MNDMEKKIIINVGRQLGSGGHDIGRMLAMDFAAHYYDRELLNLAAKESGLSEKFLAKSDEHRSIIRSFLHLPGGLGTGSAYSRQGLSQDSFFQLQSDAIRKAAADHSCVFVGRCADYVLRDMPNVVKVFITASMRSRIDKLLAQRSMTPQQAKRYILQAEEKRASYYNYYTGKTWGAAESYDLCIDSSILGLEETEKLIADFIRKQLDV
jgi:cytidylate kinase